MFPKERERDERIVSVQRQSRHVGSLDSQAQASSLDTRANRFLILALGKSTADEKCGRYIFRITNAWARTDDPPRRSRPPLSRAAISSYSTPPAPPLSLRHTSRRQTYEPSAGPSVRRSLVLVHAIKAPFFFCKKTGRIKIARIFLHASKVISGFIRYQLLRMNTFFR